MASYAVLYSNVTGFVLGAWLRAASDNLSTMLADGHLTVDGTRVVEGLGGGDGDGARTDITGALIADPTYCDPEAPLGTQQVDSTSAPTTVTLRSDGGRNPLYPHYE